MDDVFKFPTDELASSRKQWKPGVRVLGVAESFEKRDEHSYVAGIIMRGDLRIDGFGFCHPTVGGWDSTENLLEMFERIDRTDLRAWMLGGCIISWFNSVDIDRLHKESSIPVICVSYEPSEGLEKYLREYFPDSWKERLNGIIAIGKRKKIELDSGYDAFIAVAGIDLDSAAQLVNQFTNDGRIPEPIRVARHLASELRKHLSE